jgi:voltage-gated potassium channel
MHSPDRSAEQALESERSQVLRQLEDWLETPMLVLGFTWLALLVIELVWGLSPLLQAASTAIWIIFIVDFAAKFTLAPRKLVYLRHNWLTAISLLLPALRVLRIARVVQAARGLRLLRIVTSMNRGMKALGASMRRRGFGYVVALTAIVLLAGAAGMYAFENEVHDGLDSYGTALWWTAMLLTSLGSEYWPQTAEGRVLCFLLALYGFAVFGYVTAALATFFIGRDADDKHAELAGAQSIEALSREIAALRTEIRALRSDQG